MKRKSNNAVSFDIDLDSESLESDANKALGNTAQDDEDEFNFDDNQYEDNGLNPSDDDEDIEDDGDEDASNEDDTDEEGVSQEDNNENIDSEDDDSEDDVKQKTPSNKKSPNNQKQFGERANKRIRDLNARAKTAEDYANRIAQEADADRKARYEAEKERVLTQKELLELKQERLKTQYINASQDGDYEKQAEANAELAKIGTQLAAIEGVAAKYKGEYKPEPRQQMPQPQVDFDMEKANQLATDFEFENPRLLTDPVFKDTATKIAEGLMKRGFKPDTEDFYSELSNRMDKAFGNNLVNNKVSGKTNTQTNHTNKVVARKPAPQAVSGASRTPAPQSGNNTNSKNSVRLTSQQIAEAQRLGQDLKTYAKNQKRIEDSIKNKGRVSVYLEDL